MGAFGALGALACATNEPGDASSSPPSKTIPPADAAPNEASSDAGDDGGCSADAGCVTTTDCTLVDFCSTELPVTRSITLNAVWGSGANDVWIVGTRGTVLHGDGTTLTPLPSGTSDVFFAVWGTGPDDVWLMSGTSPLRSHGFVDGSASFEPVLGSTWNPYQAATGRLWTGTSLAPDQVWIGGEPTGRFDPFGGSGSLFRLGIDESSSAIWRPESACSFEQTCTPQIRALWGTSASSLWAVGLRGQTFLLDDPDAGHWAYRNSNTSWDLEAIWGSSASDVWAVGANGTILHSSGTASEWTATQSPTTNTLHSVWGSGPNDVWTVGDGGTVLHYDGRAWTLATIGVPPGDVPRRLFGVWGSGPDDVWIVGEGLILHRTATNRSQP